MSQMSEQRLRARSVLFVPGHRGDMIAKTAGYVADVVVVDLEDAVPPDDKDTARSTAVTAIAALSWAATVLIRINPAGTPWFTEDLAAAASSAAAGVVVPKLETPGQLADLKERLAALDRRDAVVAAGIESALGVADARVVLAAGVDAAYFGAEDYIADLGGHRTGDGQEVLYARSQVSVAARLAGIPAIDQAVLAIRDDERFLADARQGAALGYQGKICVHPRQAGLANGVFTPSVAEVARAREVLAAGSVGVGLVAGQMVDRVHVRMAEAVLRRAGEPT
jgi:citrate lyase subunit beta/citryl-CoA lyase